MFEQSPLDYYAKRLEQEAKLAATASDPAVRRAHQQLAEGYRHIVESGEPPEPRSRPLLQMPFLAEMSARS